MSHSHEDHIYFRDVSLREDFIISYNTAVLARERGYDVTNEYCYDPKCRDVNHIYNWCSEHGCSTKGRMDRLVSAPTQSLLLRWIRVKHAIHVEIYSNASGWGWILTKLNGTGLKEIEDSIFFGSYEKALEEGLRQALNHIS